MKSAFSKTLSIVCAILFSFVSAPQVFCEEYKIPRSIQKIIHQNPSKTNLIRYTHKRYPHLTEYYSQRQGAFAIEALRADPVAAIYSMEVFPGYFRTLAQKTSAAEAAHFIKVTSHYPQLFEQFEKKWQKYQDKPKLLGLLIRSHVHAKDHLLTEIEGQSSYLATRFVEIYSKASTKIRNGVLEYPNAAFFILETKEDGIEALKKYGDIVVEISTFYKAGERKDVIRELKIGGKSFILAFENSSIVGWRTAIRFPKLYKNLVSELGVSQALDFLNANGHYIASYVQDPTDDVWITSITQQVKSMRREGVLNFTSVDSFAFALCSEVKEGKELIARMGKYLPAALIYHHYPRHKTFLTRFLNRYGIAPLKMLYECSKQENKKLELENIIDKFGSEGLLLISYSPRREEAVELLLEEGYDRGQDYLDKFVFDEFGVPSYKGSQDIMPDLAKVTMNYFWYGTKPTWAEFGLAIWDGIDLLQTIYTFGSSKLITQSGKMLLGKATAYTFVKLAKNEAKKFTLSKLKKIALSIAWKSFKKVLRKELVHQRFNQLEKLTVYTVSSRMGKNFAKTSWKYSYNIALNEFLTYVFD